MKRRAMGGSDHGFGGALWTERLLITGPAGPQGGWPRHIPHRARSPPARPRGVPRAEAARARPPRRYLPLELPDVDVALAELGPQQVLAAQQRQPARAAVTAAVPGQGRARVQLPDRAVAERPRRVRHQRHLHGRRHLRGPPGPQRARPRPRAPPPQLGADQSATAPLRPRGAGAAHAAGSSAGAVPVDAGWVTRDAACARVDTPQPYGPPPAL